MSVSPAEPLSNAAAKLALELNEVLSMFGTVFNGNITTVRTD